MKRRDFLLMSGGMMAWQLVEQVFHWPVIGSSALDRATKWAPNPNPLLLIEWRYAAGRVVDGDQDFGFLISISTTKAFGPDSYAFLVQRQDFTGNKAFVENIYEGTLTYHAYNPTAPSDPLSATYIFEDEAPQELLRWQWDEGIQAYKLSVTTPELTLEDLVLIPQGPLIPEGGDGEIGVGQVAGLPLESEYHADWTIIEIDGEEKGTARVDMQGLIPAQSAMVADFGYPLEQLPQTIGVANGDQEYDHRWFAIAVELSNGSPAWISAWRIEDDGGSFWCVTVALGSGGTWQVSSITEEDAVVAPLEITTLAWQAIPPAIVSGESTGSKWRITAGTSQPNDLIDLTVTVPPGQISSSPKLIVASWVEEAVGIEAEGTVMGIPINSVKMVAAESSTEFYPTFIPLIRR